MFKINIWKIYPVAWTDMQQARVFINDSTFKPTSPIWVIYKDEKKSTHKYTFISTTWNTKMWSWKLTTLKNKVLERYVNHIRKTNLDSHSIPNNLSDDIVIREETLFWDVPIALA